MHVLEESSSFWTLLNIYIYFFFISDIEAQIREIQSKKKEIQSAVTEKEQVGLGKTGFYDQDIYDGSNNKYDGYVTSIAANDEIEVHFCDQFNNQLII